MELSLKSMQNTKATPDWRAHVAIARPDHWFKNVFMLPGVVVAASTVPSFSWSTLALRTLIAAAALCLIASSYYTLNELLDEVSGILDEARREIRELAREQAKELGRGAKRTRRKLGM